MQKIDLLPCPFCGRKPKISKINSQLYQIVCLFSKCPAHLSCVIKKTPEEATQAWNTRASGWIPCSAKLPEVGEPVLIYEPYNDEMVVASLDCDKTGFSNDDYWYGLKSVPFWMRLPEKPKEVHHDEN